LHSDGVFTFCLSAAAAVVVVVVVRAIRFLGVHIT